MSYAAYLTNTHDGHSKQYFVAVYKRKDGQWVVGTAWGKIGLDIFGEKHREGGKSGPKFSDEGGAERYARAVTKGQRDRDGYSVPYCSDSMEWSTFVGWCKGVLEITPKWFDAVARRITPKEEEVDLDDEYTKPIAAKIAKEVAATIDETDFATTPGVTESPYAAVYRKAKAKLPIADLKGKMAARTTPKEKGETHGFKPRFVRVERK